MAGVLDSAPYAGVNTAYKRGTILHAVISFASGAPSVVAARSAPGITIADGASGAYTGTFPKCGKAVAWTQQLRAVHADSARCDFVAFSPTAGTFTLQNYINDAPADVADDDELWLFFMCEGG